MIAAGDFFDVGWYMYMPAFVGPELKPVTCCKLEDRAVAAPARAKDAARVERKRIFPVGVVQDGCQVMCREIERAEENGLNL